ncbi:MAG: CAP domain-containing protein [Actinomycetota bacterium]|nr:CAP domain-containing protein [Actinomycetota bacterium]
MVTVRLTLPRLTVVLLAAALLLALVPASDAQALDPRDGAQIRQDLEQRVNTARRRHDLRPLKISWGVLDEARGHSRQMQRRQKIFHDRNLRHEVPPSTVAWGENVGRTTASDAAQRLHYLLMRSPGHRANILGDYNHMVVAIAKGGRYTYATQRFFERR